MSGAGPPLVLLPGMMCDARAWAAVAARLPGVAVTHARIDGADTVGELAERVLADAPPVFRMAGLSMGAIVGFELWRRAPERIAGIALVDTNAGPDANPHRARQIADVRAGRLEAVVRDELKASYVHADARLDRALMDTIMAMAMELGADVFERQSRALMARPDSRPTLPTIDVPTMVLCGEDDVVCPVATHRAMADAVPGATLTVVPRAGHLATMEAPGAVADAIGAWLQRR